MRSELQDRLAALRVDIDGSAAERHLTELAAELRNPRPPTRSGRMNRVRIAAVAAAAVLLVLPAVAVASEGAVPGDLLYPVKLATERVRLIVDPNIEAEHRIEEVETVVDRAAPYEEVSDRLADADAAVRDRAVPADLADRLETVRQRITTDYPDASDVQPRKSATGDRPATDPPSGPVPSSSTTTITTPPETDRPPQRDPQPTTTTTSPPTDRPVRDATTTTTLPDDDRDRPPGDDRG